MCFSNFSESMSLQLFGVSLFCSSSFPFDFTASGVFICSFFVLFLNVGCCPERESWRIHFGSSWGLDCFSLTDLTTDPLVPMILKVGEISPSAGCHFKTTWLHLQVSICWPFCDSPGFSLIHINAIQILWLLAVYPQ